jgi:FKBP-type peptidyl-prolyl cis-trans isomerase
LGIKYINIEEGRGSAYPVPGDFVVINYTGFLANGTVFDSTETKSRKPLSFRMGKNQVVPGLEDVVSYMKPGGIATCTIPSELAFGAKGICIENEGCLVPPNETLKYVVKLLRVGSGYN